MDELTLLLKCILSEMHEINSKLDNIKGIGTFNSISDVCDKLDGIEDKIIDLEGIIEDAY